MLCDTGVLYRATYSSLTLSDLCAGVVRIHTYIGIYSESVHRRTQHSTRAK